MHPTRVVGKVWAFPPLVSPSLRIGDLFALCLLSAVVLPVLT